VKDLAGLSQLGREPECAAYDGTHGLPFRLTQQICARVGIAPTRLGEHIAPVLSPLQLGPKMSLEIA
jgi:hypothetical protein